MGLPRCSVGNESSFNVGDVSLIPGLGRPSGGGNSKQQPTPLFLPGECYGQRIHSIGVTKNLKQLSTQAESGAAVHGVPKSQT